MRFRPDGFSDTDITILILNDGFIQTHMIRMPEAQARSISVRFILSNRLPRSRNVMCALCEFEKIAWKDYVCFFPQYIIEIRLENNFFFIIILLFLWNI